MTEEELAHIETLCNAATPGEWEKRATKVWADDTIIAAAIFSEDADFIAASRQAVPQLIAELRRLREALDLYREAVVIDAKMDGPKFMGSNSSALKRAWDHDRAALEGK